MKNKTILYLGGGAMSGIFGAGVVSALEEMNVYPRIEAVYGCSAGVMNAAYFLSEQVRSCSSIYYEDMVHDFAVPSNFFVGIVQRFWHRFVRKLPEERIRNVTDIDYIMDVITRVKPLNIKKILGQDVDFYVSLLNVSTADIEYVDVKKFDPLAVLKAGVSIAPYYFGSQLIDGNRYIDGAIKEKIGLRYFLQEHPHSRIIVVLNEPTALVKRLHLYGKNFLEGLVVKLMYDLPFSIFLNRERLFQGDIGLARRERCVLLIQPPSGNQTMPYTTDYSKLVTTYKMGKQEARKIKKFLGL